MTNHNNAEWRERLKHKPVRYWIRDEIEEIIKEENVDRSRFHEVSKYKYEEIIHKFYYSFCDYENYPTICLNYMRIHFHKRLKISKPICCKSWIEYICTIEEMIPEEQHDQEFYLILSDGWVYEGNASEIITVLSEVDGLLDDFYVVSKHFDWFIAHSDDGESMIRFSLELTE